MEHVPHQKLSLIFFDVFFNFQFSKQKDKQTLESIQKLDLYRHYLSDYL